ncbi:response regulator [Desulfovibrio inopinatus]|uniref:response regulator n=1 Tax=Desulfovibrio inopinatus TaxID=102109 RepID=UPI00041A80F7|nr:response regulator [Desulfovibrio inopinatus]
MKSILLVDDEPLVLSGIRRSLFGLLDDIDILTAGSGAEALDILAQENVDVIITDMRMPGMDGGELLIHVKELYPQTVRIILSGYTDKQYIMRTVGPAHRFLAKPCSDDELLSTLNQATALRELLKDKTLQNIVHKTDTLPTPPELYTQIIAEASRDDADLGRIAKIVSQDMAMTASLLKLVNSAFFGFPRSVVTPKEAVTLLGVDVIQGLVLTAHFIKEFNTTQFPFFNPSDLETHCLMTARLARLIYERHNNDSVLIQMSFLAGMLHDIGKLILATAIPDEYAKVISASRENNRALLSMEYELLGFSHAHVGGYLLGLWGLPGQVVDAVAFHHEPDSTETSFTPTLAVHIANVFDHELRVVHAEYATPIFNDNALARAGVAPNIDADREACLSLLPEE